MEGVRVGGSSFLDISQANMVHSSHFGRIGF
jgi:hypothetical protein